MNAPEPIDAAEMAAMRRQLQDALGQPLRLVEAEAASLYSVGASVLANAVDQRLAERADLSRLIGENPVEVMFVNHANHAQFMRSLFRLRSPALLTAVLEWVYRSYAGRGFSYDYFPVELQAWIDAIDRFIAPRSQVHWLKQFYQSMLDCHDTLVALAETREPEPSIDERFREPRDAFLAALLAANEEEAEDALRAHVTRPEELPLYWQEVVAPALHAVGRMWADGEISVAQEHIATAITQRVMARMFPRIEKPPTHPHRVVVAVSPGETHEVGARMVADKLRLGGFDVLFTGADTPIESIADLTRDTQAGVLLVSTTLPFNLIAVNQLVKRVREKCDPPPRIIVGGQAYASDPDLWRQIGADARLDRLDELCDAVTSVA